MLELMTKEEMVKRLISNARFLEIELIGYIDGSYDYEETMDILKEQIKLVTKIEKGEYK